jgi:hypothetical protein
VLPAEEREALRALVPNASKLAAGSPDLAPEPGANGVASGELPA